MAATELKSAVELGNFVEQSVELKSLKTTVESAQEKVEKQKALNALLTRMELRKDPTTGKYTIKLDDPKDPTGCGTYEFTSPDLLQGFAKDVLKMDGKLSIVEQDTRVEMRIAESAIANQVDDLKQTIAINAPSNVTITNNVTTTYTETSTGSTTGTTSNSTADASHASTNTASTSTASADAKKIVGGSTDVSKDTAAKKETPATDATGTTTTEKAGDAKTPEVAKEKTKEEKLAEANELLAGLHMKIVEEKQPDGTMQPTINLSPAEFAALKNINLSIDPATLTILGVQQAKAAGVNQATYGAQFRGTQNAGGSDENANEKTADGLTRRQKRLERKAQNGNENAAERLKRSLEADVKKDQKMAVDVLQIANLKGKKQQLEGVKQVGRQKGSDAYNGITYNVAPYHPAFANICQTVYGMSGADMRYIDVAGRKVLVRGPEYASFENSAVQQVTDEVGYMNAPTSSPLNPNSWGGKLANFMDKETNLSSVDAQKLVKGGGALALGVGAVWGLNWLFNGNNLFASKDGKGFNLADKMKESFLRRVIGVVGGATVLNWGSKMLNGKPIKDAIMDVIQGKSSFSDLIKNPNSHPETALNSFAATGSVLHDLPMGVLAQAVTPQGTTGMQINAEKLYQVIDAKVKSTTGTEKDMWGRKLQAVKALVNDKAALVYVNESLSHMASYNDVVDPAKQGTTLNDKITMMNQRETTLNAYIGQHQLQWKPGVPATDVVSYMTSTMMTPADLEKKGLLVPMSAGVNVQTSQANPEIGKEKLDTKLQALVGHNGYTVENITTLVTAASTINGKKANAVTLETNDNGVLYIRNAQGWDVPLTVNDSNYQIADLDITFAKDQAEQALNIALLTGKIIADRHGTAKEGMKNYFTVGFGDSRMQKLKESARLGEGDLNFDNGIATISLVDGEDRWASTAKDLGGEKFQTRMRLYADWLNGLKSTTGKSIWEKNSGVTNWKQMSYEATVKTKVAEADKKQAATSGSTNTGSTNVVPVILPTPSPDKSDAAKTDKKDTPETKKAGNKKEKEPVVKRTPEQAKEDLKGLNDLISQTENTPAARGSIIDKTGKLLNEAYPQLGMRIEKGNGFIRVFSHGDKEGTKVNTVDHCVVDDRYGAGAFDSTPDRWRELIRIACLTNWVKQNFHARSEVNAPFELSGEDIQFDGKSFWNEIKEGDLKRLFFDVDVVDNEDNVNSTAKEIGGAAFQSQHSAYKDWLNSMHYASGESLWRKDAKNKTLPGEVPASYSEVLKYVGNVKDSFNEISDTEGIGTGKGEYHVEDIQLGQKAIVDTGKNGETYNFYEVKVTYTGKEIAPTMLIDPEKRMLAYRHQGGHITAFGEPFANANIQDMLALAVLTDSALARYTNRGKGESPVNTSNSLGTSDLEISLDDGMFHLDHEILEGSDMRKYSPWLATTENMELYARCLNTIGAFQTDGTLKGMRKGSVDNDASITHATGRIM